MLRWVLAASGLILSPFGPVSDLLQSKNPWQGFDAQGPILTVLRVHRFHTKSCEKWIRAITSDLPGLPWKPETPSWKAWEPWSEDASNAVDSCKSVPCDVKLNAAESSQMASISGSNKTTSLKKYLSLVQGRALNYTKSGERKEYEFPGDPIDPWATLEKRGFASSLSRPSLPSFRVRMLEFAPEKVKTLRQVIDRRVAQAQNGLEAVVWVRDVYTDHYFDSWGEWTRVTCGSAKDSEVLLIQALVVELDLLKKTDVISQLMRGKMRSAIEDGGAQYLNDAFIRWSNVDSNKGSKNQSRL